MKDTWLDFLIAPDLLDDYLKNGPDDIKETFLSIVHSALPLNNINKHEIIVHFEGGRLLYETEKTNNLKSLGLKIAAHFYFNLNFLYKNLKVYQIWALIEYLYNLVKIDSNLVCTLNSVDDGNELLYQDENNLLQFCLILKYRLIVYLIIQESFPVKPKKVYTFAIPGQYDQTMLKCLHDGIITKFDNQLTKAINWLEKFLEKNGESPYEIYFPKTTYFVINSSSKSLLTETYQKSQDLNKDNSLQIMNNNIITCQIHYDLGSYYFMCNEMSKAKNHFTKTWNIYKGIDDPLHPFFTLDAKTLEGYCLACDVSMDDGDDKKSNGQFTDKDSFNLGKNDAESMILDKILYHKENYEVLLPLLISGLSNSDIHVQIYQILESEILTSQLWPSDYCRKLRICTFIKSILTGHGFSSTTKNSGPNVKLIPKSDVNTSSDPNSKLYPDPLCDFSVLFNIPCQGSDELKFFVQILEGINLKELSHLQKDRLRNFISYALAYLPPELAFYKALSEFVVKYPEWNQDTSITPLGKVTDKVETTLENNVISSDNYGLDPVMTIPTKYNLFGNQTFVMAELERKLIISRDPLVIKEILLQLSTNFQRLPPIPSHAHSILPSYLQTCLINLPPGIRRNFIHLVLSKARQSNRVQEYTDALALLQVAENEVFLFQEQYQGEQPNPVNALTDPLLKLAATLLKYIGWEKLYLEIRRTLPPYTIQDGVVGDDRNEVQNSLTNKTERVALIVLVKKFLHAILSTEQDPSILNSDIVLGAVGFLIREREYDYLISIPPSNMFYTNLASLLTYIKCEFDVFREDVINVKLVDLSANIKIAISKLWDFINPIFSNNTADIPVPHPQYGSHDSCDKEISHHVTTIADNARANRSSPTTMMDKGTAAALSKRSKTPPVGGGKGAFVGTGGNISSNMYDTRSRGGYMHPPLLLPPPPPPTHFGRTNPTGTPYGNTAQRIPSFGSRVTASSLQQPQQVPLHPPMMIGPPPLFLGIQAGPHQRYEACGVDGADRLLKNFVTRSTDVDYLTILGSCLLKIFTLIKDDIFIDFSFDYQQLWPSILLFSQYRTTTLSDMLNFAINRAEELSPTPAWLILRADLEYVNKNWIRAMQYYVKALSLKTQYFLPALCQSLSSFSNDIFSRMVKCCLALRANIEAALICQLMQPVDYTKAFLALQEMFGVNEGDISNTTSSYNTIPPIYTHSDSCYDLFWDDSLLEYLGHLNSTNGPVEKIKRSNIIDVLSDSNLNPNNDRSVIEVAKSYKTSKLIQFLAQNYLI